jgi:cytochrome c-type biogenesis protein
MIENSNVSIIGAFIAGLLSFLSPCVLPLIPSYITYITGLSFAELQSDHPSHKVRMQTIRHSLLFIAGFTFVFVLLGASATFIGGFIQQNTRIITKVGGILIVLFGIHVSGFLPFTYLLKEKRINIHSKPAGYVGSFIVGIVFAAGWTPCIGPILASILMVAATEETVHHGIVLLFSYSMGLAIPFFLAALALHQFLVLFNRYKKFIRLFEVISGLFLVVVGILIFFDKMKKIGAIIPSFWGG